MDFIRKRIKSMKILLWIKKLLCKHKGHDWEVYSYSTGYYSYDVEMAGYCKRCGFDTHAEYEGDLND